MQQFHLISQMSMVGFLLFLIAFQSSSGVQMLDGPLLNGATWFAVTAETSTLVQPTPCFITSDSVSQCRRKRGIEERPIIIQNDNWDIAPSAVIGVQTTKAPRSLRSRFNVDNIFSSFDDSYSNTLNIFQQLEARGRNNFITVGDCGMSTINFSEFLSCLGMTVQETTTLTATFTQTTTLSSGYTTFTVAGCTPAGFPYSYCPKIIENTTTNNGSVGPDSTTSSVSDGDLITASPGTEESFTCEDDSKTLSCPAGQGIVIDFANYGRTTHPVCVQDQERDKPNNCYTPSHTVFIATFCNGQSSCVVPATNSFFGDTCPNVFKYLQIKYHCSGSVGPDSTSTSSGSEYFSTPAPDGSYYIPGSGTPWATSSPDVDLNTGSSGVYYAPSGTGTPSETSSPSSRV